MSHKNNLLPRMISSLIKHLEMGLIAAGVLLYPTCSGLCPTLAPSDTRDKEPKTLSCDGIVSLRAGSNPQTRRAFSTTPSTQKAPLEKLTQDEIKIKSRKNDRALARARRDLARRKSGTKPTGAGNSKLVQAKSEVNKPLKVRPGKAGEARRQTAKLAGQFAPLLPSTRLTEHNIISRGAAYYCLNLFTNEGVSDAWHQEEASVRNLTNAYPLLAVEYKPASHSGEKVAPVSGEKVAVLSFGQKGKPFATVHVHPFDLSTKERKVVFHPTNTFKDEMTALLPEIHYLTSKEGTSAENQ